MSQRVESSTLDAIFVFNPTLGSENTEGKKILYFHPQTLPLDTQKDYVGITEGLAHFVRDFSPNDNVSAVHCEKKRYAFLECEPDYWIALVITNPKLSSSSSTSSAASNDLKHTEYLENELEDSVLQAIVERCYNLYRLFHGRFDDKVLTVRHSSEAKQADFDDHDCIRSLLSRYMPYFIRTVNWGQLPFFTDIHGFQFLSVDKITFLTVQYMCNLIQANFDRVQRLAIMYQGKLIWSSIEQEDMFLLYSLDQEAMYCFYTYLATCQTTRSETSLQLQAHVSSVKSSGSSSQQQASSSQQQQQQAQAQQEKPKTIRERLLGKSTSNSSSTRTQSNSSTSAAESVDGDAGGFLTGPLRVLRKNTDYELDAKCRVAPQVFLSSEMTPQAVRPKRERFEAQKTKKEILQELAEKAARKPPVRKPTQRLVVYERYQLKFLLIVQDDDDMKKSENGSTNSADVKHPAASTFSSTDGGGSEDSKKKKADNDGFSPNLRFYANLERFTNSNLKKLADMLADQLSRSTGGSQSNGNKHSQDEYRFLYFNYMNLALKTSLHAKNAPLSMETIKVIRGIHNDFQTKKFKENSSGDLNSGDQNGNHGREIGPDEVCVKTRTQGWIVGRRATQSCREFFVLFDDSVGNLVDVKTEVDKLSRNFFYNIFIH